MDGRADPDNTAADIVILDELPRANGSVPAGPPPRAEDPRIEKLERQVAVLAWLHAEQAHQLKHVANTVAGLMMKQMSPQIQQGILDKVMGRI